VFCPLYHCRVTPLSNKRLCFCCLFYCLILFHVSLQTPTHSFLLCGVFFMQNVQCIDLFYGCDHSLCLVLNVLTHRSCIAVNIHYMYYILRMVTIYIHHKKGAHFSCIYRYKEDIESQFNEIKFPFYISVLVVKFLGYRIQSGMFEACF